MGWNRNQLMRQLRRAGWQRGKGPAAVYRHPRGGVFYLDRFDSRQGGVAWRWYAERRQLPQEHKDDTTNSSPRRKTNVPTTTA